MALTYDDIQIIREAFRPDFEQIDRRFDGIDEKFLKVDKKFELINKRFELIDKRFELIDKKFKEVNEKFKEQTQLLTSAWKETIEELYGSQSAHKRIDKLEVRVDRLENSAQTIVR